MKKDIEAESTIRDLNKTIDQKIDSESFTVSKYRETKQRLNETIGSLSNTKAVFDLV